MKKKIIRIGTRGSTLALIQAGQVAHQLQLQGANTVIVPVVTSGDRMKDKKLADYGGKVLFTKEVDAALLRHEVDVAVHSMKDVETFMAAELILTSILEREDARDVVITRDRCKFRDLKPGAVIGTSSLRRASQILIHRPDFKIVPFRGNVEPRLLKLEQGQVDATFLALAGLKRLGKLQPDFEILDPDVIVPSAGQGAIGVMCRQHDQDTIHLVEKFNHMPSYRSVLCERALLTGLHGDCSTPVGAYAWHNNDGTMSLSGIVITPDGQKSYRQSITNTWSDLMIDAQQLGIHFRTWLLENAPHALC